MEMTRSIGFQAEAQRRYLEVLNYPDAIEVSDYATSAALYCQTTGIITGREGGVFVPQGTATRAEVATMIQRFVESLWRELNTQHSIAEKERCPLLFPFYRKDMVNRALS